MPEDGIEAPDLARLSAKLLPGMYEWPGTHWKVSWTLAANRLITDQRSQWEAGSRKFEYLERKASEDLESVRRRIEEK